MGNLKTLIILVHPDIKHSKVNQRWRQEVLKYPDKFHIHELYDCYPKFNIDVVAEQNLIEKYDKIVFQFPYHWFNAPPMLLKWYHDVLTYGWAYGKSSGYKLKGKEIALAISIGVDQSMYTQNGKYKHDIDTLILPFKLTFEYVKANCSRVFTSYGLHSKATNEDIEFSTKQYLNFLNQF